MHPGQRGWSHFSPGQVVAAKTTCFFSFPSPCPAVWMRDVLGTPLSSSEAVPKLLSRSSTRGWEGCCCQLSLAATRMCSVQAEVMLCGCEGPQCPHLPVLPTLAGSVSSGRVKSCWSSSCLCWVAAKGRRKPADTPAGRSQLHLWWKPGEVARAARGTKLGPWICKPRRPAAHSMAGLHFLHIAKPSIPEIPRQAQCKGTRSRRHLSSLNASICGPLTPQSLSPCQKAVT